MPSILWGDDEGADVCLPFNGHCSLSGARLLNAGAADDDVALGYNTHAADADVVAHVLGTEGTGNAADSIGGFDIAPGAWSTDGGWIGQHAIAASWGTGGVVPQVPVNADFTVEFWWHKTAASPTDDRRFFYLGGQDYNRILFSDYRELAPGNWRYRRYLRANNPPGSSAATLVTGITFAAEWQHWSIERSGNTLRSYINGVASGGTTDASGVTTFSSQDRWSTGDGAALGWRWNDIYLTKRALHAGVDFAVGRMKSAAQNGGVQPYVQVTGSGLAGTLPTAVSWTAQTGSAYGRIHSVWVNDVTSGWVQVGGAYPTSPVSVAGLVLASNDAVRVALEPEAVSGIQNASPTLYGVRLDWAAPSASLVPRRITPVRIGPRLLPIGVIC